MTDMVDERLARLEGRASALQFLLGQTIKALAAQEKDKILIQIAELIEYQPTKNTDYAQGMLGVLQEVRRQVDVES